MADDQTPEATEAETAAASEAKGARRKKLLIILAIVVAAVAVIYLLLNWLVFSRHVSTDNAYVAAESAQITPLVGGQVIEVAVSDTSVVKRGQLLLRIDDADAKIAVAQAQADLAAAERRYGQTAATGDALAAQVKARDADIGRMQAQLKVATADLDSAQVNYDRRRALVGEGAVSGDELTSATRALETARANVVLARAAIAQSEAARASAVQERAANTALTRGTTQSTAPEVLTARARLDQARLDLSRTTIRAPMDGVVARRQVQVGQRLAAGTVAMTVVPVDRLYVDANYKEGQLGKVRIGQRAEITSDLYGGDVVYHGTVVGLAGGTGAAFSLIPAQNATGNWIKVVQRLPVRIQLDPKELRDHPLRVGLSMDVEIDVASDR
ncbi:HlyD family efflux transporter periplasmic adaptor subunit [Sphingomonas naphthae]|uniref:HlyD family efflux transporter periplasmic adaptor subunit n=1 Tax=Sphingomonas naphthae TaxID=1813468 RepID=A0ABY7TPP0_9SPHN|nr:HlyD family efflux transporter periplasmic adaptor subunit [Sphingomonas naphthae]WCT74335.1 HlyD family efflux transporter periplasmic adaptor subunit [Sphingomonas naphthae]